MADEAFALQRGAAPRAPGVVLDAQGAGDLDLAAACRPGRASTRENLGFEVLGDVAGDGARSGQRHTAVRLSNVQILAPA